MGEDTLQIQTDFGGAHEYISKLSAVIVSSIVSFKKEHVSWYVESNKYIKNHSDTVELPETCLFCPTALLSTTKCYILSIRNIIIVFGAHCHQLQTWSIKFSKSFFYSSMSIKGMDCRYYFHIETQHLDSNIVSIKLKIKTILQNGSFCEICVRSYCTGCSLWSICRYHHRILWIQRRLP